MKATGSRSVTVTWRLWGKLVVAPTDATVGKCATVLRSFPSLRCSVVMPPATCSIAFLIAGSLVVAPVTVTSSIANQERFRNQSM